MPRQSQIRRIREQLQRRRRDLLISNEATRAELADLKRAELGAEYEEGAQAELADYTLSQLIENQRRDLMVAPKSTAVVVWRPRR